MDSIYLSAYRQFLNVVLPLMNEMPLPILYNL
jgi:hypothetical protein